jgi:ATP-dependent RNA helicase DHX57
LTTHDMLTVLEFAVSRHHQMATKDKPASIKGGGRVDLSPELEDAIVDLLMTRRDSKHPLLPHKSPVDEKACSSTSSDETHSKGHNRRKFLKRLIASHERHTLSLRLNQVSLTEENSAKSTKTAPATGNNKMAPSSSGGKVRVDLVEAVYKSPDKWKAGSSKKTIVLERSTQIEGLLKQSKDKLKMKKKALRCFYVDRKIELELTNNLEGIQDGSIIYVTSQPVVEKEETATKDDDDDVLPDPLDIVKQVYANRRQQKRSRAALKPPILCVEHFDKLPELPIYRANLPAANFRTEILSALDLSRILIICGATGCGKSTQIPQYILEGMTAAGYDGNIVVTQPRRVAATALAERVATEQESRVGSLVGYQVRLDAAISDSTRITYMTVGILLRRLTTPSAAETPPLSDISHLVIDEVHERDINTDFCLTILRRVLVRNPHIKIILMSATNTPELFVNYFRSERLGIEPTVLQIPGRTFPVETYWLDDIEKMVGRKLKYWSNEEESSLRGNGQGNTQLLSPRAAAAIDNAFILQLIFHLRNNTSSDNAAILVFLPGRGEIESLARTLRCDDKETSCLDIHILHSSVSQKNQKAVFQPGQEGKIKVILATNVAETSITIPDVCMVIDTGRVKESRYNSSARIKELVTVWTSQASATQRAGRAGRTQLGFCYCLYTEAFAEAKMLERTTPEILRTPLDELVLQSCLLDEDRKDQQKKDPDARDASEGTVPVEFLSKTPDPPPIESLIHACQHLIEIDALHLVSGDDAYMRVKLTPLGYHLSQLPMDSKIGKILIVGSILGCVEPSLTVAAALSSTRGIFWNNERDKQKELVEGGFGGTNWEGGTVKGDSIASVAAYEEWSNRPNNNLRFLYAKEHGLDHNVLIDIFNLRKQFRDCLLDAGFLNSRRDKGSHSENALLTSCCLVAGLYPNVARLMRPVRGKLGFRGGRLLTNNGDVCTPSSQSFQKERVRNTSESGRDVYAVYQSKNQITGAVGDARLQKNKVFLSEVNFVSRFALLLFGGNLEVKDNFIVVDNWLKFKVGDNGRNAAILMTELRRELDICFLSQLSGNDAGSNDAVIEMVARLLQDEKKTREFY